MPMQYPDASGVPANMLPAREVSAFDQLKVLVDSEGPHLADPDWLGMLAAIGIVKGRPFSPMGPPGPSSIRLPRQPTRPAA